MRLIYTAALVVLPSLLLLAACETETDFSARRAVAQPVAQAGSEHEILATSDVGVPLLTVELPNKKNEPAHVQTIFDNIAATTRPAPATRPGAEPGLPAAPEQLTPLVPPPGEIDLVPTGPRPAALGPTTQPATFPVKLISLQKPDDELQIAGDDKTPSLTVTSLSGIGSMTLAPTARAWPAELSLRFRYGPDRPFANLEGFTAELLSAKPGAKPIPLQFARVTRGNAGGPLDVVVVTIPQGTPSGQLLVSWIDAYR